ncbi:MAG: hypothetical protein ACKVOJ_00300 [Sphingomonadaceae bacterium]
MFSFGFSTLVDLLSWVVVSSLGLKLIATLYILIVDKEMRDRPGFGSVLWWSTKITPIIAVPCLIWIALLKGETSQAWLFAAMGLFVIIAEPLKIRQRRNRITEQTSAK